MTQKDFLVVFRYQTHSCEPAALLRRPVPGISCLWRKSQGQTRWLWSENGQKGDWELVLLGLQGWRRPRCSWGHSRAVSRGPPRPHVFLLRRRPWSTTHPSQTALHLSLQGFHFWCKNCPGLFLVFQLLGICSPRSLASTMPPPQTPSQMTPLRTDVCNNLIQSKGKKNKSEHRVPCRAELWQHLSVGWCFIWMLLSL